MHIVVISHSYPTRKTIDFVFVDQLCRAFADKGEEVTIIAPQSITKCLFRNIPIVKFKTTLITEEGNRLTLYRPFWISLGSKFTNLVGDSFNKAVCRTLKKIKKPIDVIYGHFWAQAISAMPFAKERNIPLFVVAGEGELDTHKKMTFEEIADVRLFVRGVICVATKSKRESVDAGFATDEMCIVVPNGINPNLFYKRNKVQMRSKYSFSQEDFIVAFVGQWNNRKGVQRLSNALSQLDNPHIKAFFIGSGEEVPSYKYTIFEGTVSHDKLPEYLCCADIFVLPTINEGCSNAIVEAMSCGLPIASSDMEFNWDVLNESNSILYDPLDIKQIADVIERLYEDESLRDRLTKGALQTVTELTITARVEKILKYIKARLQ